MEHEEKWEPVDGIATAAARALVNEDHHGLVVTMMFSEMVDGPDFDLWIKFGRVAAYTVYEEFVHPWNSLQTDSLMIGEEFRCVFPLLLVHDSAWVHSLSERLIGFPDSVHYRLLTLDQIVDVLCNKQPEARWIKALSNQGP